MVASCFAVTTGLRYGTTSTLIATRTRRVAARSQGASAMGSRCTWSAPPGKAPVLSYGYGSDELVGRTTWSEIVTTE